jgi:hypothetical protein
VLLLLLATNSALNALPSSTYRPADSIIEADLLQELGVDPPGRGDAHLQDGQYVPVPVVRVVVDGVVTHEVKCSHPIPDSDDPHSGTAGPRISVVKGGVAILSNMRPTVYTCLSGCQRLPMRAVRAEGDTSGPAGTMWHG